MQVVEAYPLLSTIDSPADLRRLKPAEVVAVRQNISDTVLNLCKQVCRPLITKVSFDFV